MSKGAKNLAIVTRRRADRIAKGLCVQCGRIAHKTMCSRCLEAEAKRSRSRRESRAQEIKPERAPDDGNDERMWEELKAEMRIKNQVKP